MSAVVLGQSVTAISPNLTTGFLGAGGTGPYVYSIVPVQNRAGGSIDSSSGLYTAPSAYSLYNDLIQVTDTLGAYARGTIKCCSVLELFCDVIQNQMGLDSEHIYLWDQKNFQPTDNGLYIAVAVISCKPFANSNTYASTSGGLNSVQSVNMQARLQLDVVSRGPAARDQKELVIMALNSTYSQYQQEANSFYIAPISTSFNNVSQIDGAAIPYRFSIDVNIQYFVTNTQAVPYFDTFNPVQVNTNP